MSEPPSDAKLFMSYLLVGIFLILMGFGFLYMGFSPFEHPTSAIVYIISGIICIIVGIFSLIVFIVKPEGFNQKPLAKWEKKQAIKLYRCALSARGLNNKNLYYFGKPKYNKITGVIYFWDYAIPGEIIIHDSVFIFKSYNTTLNAKRNKLSIKYIKSPLFSGYITVKLDLRKLKYISKPDFSKHASPGYQVIVLRFEPHGQLLKDNIKKLFFLIRTLHKHEIIELYHELKFILSGLKDKYGTITDISWGEFLIDNIKPSFINKILKKLKVRELYKNLISLGLNDRRRCKTKHFLTVQNNSKKDLKAGTIEFIFE